MYCPKCGAENVEEAKFCGSCGNALALRKEPLQSSVGPASESKAVSSELKIGVIIGTIIIPLIGLIMGGMYINDNSDEKKKVGRLWLFTGLGMVVIYCLIALGSGGY